MCFWIQQRVAAALPRIQALNPLVKVQPSPCSEAVLLDEAAEARGLNDHGVDVVIVTATTGKWVERDTLVSRGSSLHVESWAGQH